MALRLMDKIFKFFNPGTRRRKEQETIRKLIFESVRPTIKTIQHSVGPTIEPVRVQHGKKGGFEKNRVLHTSPGHSMGPRQYQHLTGQGDQSIDGIG
jgi:hypothetical protein